MLKEKKNKDLGLVIANRLNSLFFVVVLLFTILLFRLVDMQLLHQEFYQEKLTKTQVYTVKTAHPRGQIFDAKGRPLVTNTLKEVVAFTRTNSQTAEEIKTLAAHLANVVSLTETAVTRREKIDYYLADTATYREVVESLPDDKRFDRFGNRLKESEVYQAAVDIVTDEQIAFSEDELKLVYIFSQMNGTPAFDTVSLKTASLSPEQIAALSSNNELLSGLSVRTDWERQKSANSLTPLLGQVSSQESGLPAEEAEAYLEKGYSMNDRVGTSYLEKYYEEQLQGSKTNRTIILNKDNDIVLDEITQEGEQGKNLKLTVDLEFQQGVEALLNEHFQERLSVGSATYSEGMYAVVLNPQTGAILSLAGLDHNLETGEVTSDPLGTITKVFTPGSVVKGATLTAGWENGVLTGNETLIDQPIQFSESKPINSWFTTSVGSLPITAVDALEYSSNTYMVQIALRLMGLEYSPGMILPDNVGDAMTKLRATYAQYGMGTSTGIDLVGESIGYVPDEYSPANVLTEAFGQFDNYTPLQLAQYVSTVANGGRRIAPHLVEGLYSSSDPSAMGEAIQTIEPQVLNTLPISAEDLGLIQTGFYNVVNGSGAFTTGSPLAGQTAVTVSAKTGTAETYVSVGDQVLNTYNFNVISYAASDAPEIAVAVVFPHSTESNSLTSLNLTRDIINLYYAMKG